MTFAIRIATPTDAEGIVRLLASHWSEEGWSPAKHAHYYRDYPDGDSVAVIAIENGEVVAHAGFLPVRIATPTRELRAYLVLQVLVSKTHRRGATLVEILRYAEAECRARGAHFLCGFANKRFAKVAQRFVGWKIPGYLRFVDVDAIDLRAYRDRYRFAYTDAWYRWKLGVDKLMPFYVKPYTSKDGVVHQQLLKTRGDVARIDARSIGVPALNLWHPDRSLREDSDDWIQPFLVQPLVDDVPDDLLDLGRWFIEMGDNDTFEPHRPWLPQGSVPSYARTI